MRNNIVGPLREVDRLLPLVNDETPTDDPNYIALDSITILIEAYEDIHYPIESTNLAVEGPGEAVDGAF